jgi:hypothetical protein
LYTFDDKAAELQGAAALLKDEYTGYMTIGDKWFALVPVTDVSAQANKSVTCPVEIDVMDAGTEQLQFSLLKAFNQPKIMLLQ